MPNNLTERIKNLSGEKQELLRLLLQKEKTTAGRNTERQATLPTPTEEIILPIWRDILKLNMIGIHDNFFKLGGDSLAATRLLFHIKELFNVDIPVYRLIEMPTITQLAVFIDNHKTQAADKPSAFSFPCVISEPTKRYEAFPLTDVQQAYWIGRNDYLELGNISTHRYLEFDCTGLNIPRLEQALNMIVKRHDMLRAIVRPDGEQQILFDVPVYRIKIFNAGLCTQSEAEAELNAIRERMSHHILPSDQWPLFEICASVLNNQITRLHISMDALMVDAWSIMILSKELSQYYDNPESVLPQLQISFRDYVKTELSLKDSEVYKKSHDYWQERLPHLPPAPPLPFARNASTVKQVRFSRHTGKLESDKWKKLKTLAAEENLTPSIVMLTAYAYILAAWSRQHHFTINLTLFNRLPLHSQVDKVVGDFTSLTLLEINHSSTERFVDQAHKAQTQLWQDIEHRYVSGIQLLREINSTQAGAPRSIMPIVFTSTLTQHTLDDKIDSIPDATPASQNGLFDSRRIVYSITQTPQVWLDHIVSEQQGMLFFYWDAVEGLFPAGMLDDMFDAYLCLLERLAGGKEAWRETACSLIPVRESSLALYKKMNTTQSPVSDQCLYKLFAARAEAAPAQEAVITSGMRLSYGILFRYANQVGCWLRERGAKPNDLVAVVMHKGWEQVVAVLGILNAGAAYLPVSADLPRDRIWYLLKCGSVSLVLTQPSVDQELTWPENIERLSINENNLKPINISIQSPVHTVNDLAYVIFTSGSTGLPKGVMIDHRGAVNTILDINERFQVSANDKILAVSALNFDLSVYDIFGMLAAGAAIVIPDADKVHDSEHWSELINREKITLWNSVPALMEILIDYCSDKNKYLTKSMRLALLSGDWIPLNLPIRIRNTFDNIEIWSGGGATEASIWSILYPIKAINPDWTSIPYGKPMKNQSFYILNQALNPCPLWVTGDLYIGGIGLAKGYWADNEKTAASFIMHPITGERLYKTGDLGRYLPDGNIEFSGREDFQVKIRGHRIELGEIEAVLSQYPGVCDAVVTLWTDRDDVKRIVACLTAGTEAVPASDDLRRFLQSRLADYMIPSYFIVLDKIPLTANGKIDRKGLPAPDQLHADDTMIFQEARNPIEEVLSDIWCELLQMERVSVFSNFFELGGHSLLILKVVAMAKQKNILLTPRQCMQHPTIAGLAVVTGKISVVNDQSMFTGEIPFIPKLFLEYIHAPAAFWWEVILRIDIPVKLSAAVLEEAATALIIHHDGLRLRITKDSSAQSGYRQCIAAPGKDAVTAYHDISAFTDAEREKYIQATVDEEWAKINIDTGPVIRLVYFVHGENRLNSLIMITHHAVSDMISADILRSDFLTACSQLLQGKAISLPLKSSSIREWAEKMKAYALSAEGEKEYAYWNSLSLSDIKRLPEDYTPDLIPDRFHLQDSRGSLSSDETKHLIDLLNNDYSFTMQDILLACLSITIKQWAGNNKLLLSVVDFGRDQSQHNLDLTRTVGDFICGHPEILEVKEEAEFPEILQSIKAQRDLIPNNGNMVYWLYGYRGSLMDSGLAQGTFCNAVFLYQGQWNSNKRDELKQAGHSEIKTMHSSQSKIDGDVPDVGWQFNIKCSIQEGIFNTEWSYCTVYYKPATVENLVHEYLQTLRLFINKSTLQ